MGLCPHQGLCWARDVLMCCGQRASVSPGSAPLVEQESPALSQGQDFRLAPGTLKSTLWLFQPSQQLLEQQLCARPAQIAGLERATCKVDVCQSLPGADGDVSQTCKAM